MWEVWLKPFWLKFAFAFPSSPSPGASMAGWERHGEAAKYHKDSGDANLNPRHVGAPLRTISMEERIEERRKIKENQKKGPVSMALSESENEEEVPKPAAAAPSAESKK